MYSVSECCSRQMGVGDTLACGALLVLALAVGAAVATAFTREGAAARPRPLGASAVAELLAVVETLRGVDTERAVSRSTL